MKSFKDVNRIAECIPVAVNESSLSRVWKHATEHDSGTISAFRYAEHCGDGKVYSKSMNKSRNAKLKSKLLSMGYGVTKIDGVYIENYKSDDERHVREESFLVIDMKDSGKLRKDLIALGKEFDQDSITYCQPSGAYVLISTNTCPKGYPGNGKVGVTIKLGKSMFGKKGEFHSTVNGRPFVFESCANNCPILTDFSISEIRSIKEMAKSVLLPI